VTGEEFADALSVAPVSAARARPVLLALPWALPDVTQQTLANLGVTRVIIVGGEGP
jgi:putative cell wall-binding protein